MTNHDLERIAEDLNWTYLQGSLRYTISFKRMKRAWGKAKRLQAEAGLCNGTIYIHPVAVTFPLWVLKGLIWHELVHLIHPNHSKAFRRMTWMYPLQVEAEAYLDCHTLLGHQTREYPTNVIRALACAAEADSEKEDQL